ncbi:MAG: hypothetical protein NDI69_14395 [Bacteriovoracaceae bacterium]|nr:hypothetical protein [Bacteriovoracaceae bacterium]
MLRDFASFTLISCFCRCICSSRWSSCSSFCIITFDENVDAASVLAADFDTSLSTCTGILLSNFNTVGATVTFDVAATCASGQTLDINASGANFQDGLGNNGSSSSTVTYTQP